MSGTKRVPVGRHPRMQITPLAVALFGQLEKARRQRRAAGCVRGIYGQCVMTCRPCRAWLDGMGKLHAELGLKPWEWPCVPCCPYPPGSMKAREWEPDGPGLELWQQLERARRAAVAVPDAAKKSPDRIEAEKDLRNQLATNDAGTAEPNVSAPADG